MWPGIDMQTWPAQAEGDSTITPTKSYRAQAVQDPKFHRDTIMFLFVHITQVTLHKLHKLQVSEFEE